MDDPPLEPPRLLRPFLQFVRLPDHALAAVRKALDDDVDFRVRVAERASEEELGRAAWLFLNRPPGWEGELTALAGDEQAAAESVQEEKAERTAVRRLAKVEQAVERAERVAAKARAETANAVAELAEERRARRVADDSAAELARRVATLEEDAATGRRRIADAKVELSRWRARTAQLEADLARADARPPLDPAGIHGALAAVDDAVQAVRRAVHDAQNAMAVDDGLTAEGAARTAPSSPKPATHRAAPRRRPTTLPPAVFEDSAAAAAHLVRVPGMLVLVDGYNAAMAIWPGIELEHLRQRLVDALAELAARAGPEVHVVFDGADLAGSFARPGGKVPVRVTFSPPDIEADDVILDLVDARPFERPVVVASSDRRVQDGARSRGANVVSSPQLAQLLGR